MVVLSSEDGVSGWEKVSERGFPTRSVKHCGSARSGGLKTRAPRGLIAHWFAQCAFKHRGIPSAHKNDSSVRSDIFIANASEDNIKPLRGDMFVVALAAVGKRILEYVAPTGLLMISENEGYKYGGPYGPNFERCRFSRNTT